jgi:hypothetical protein
MIDLKETERNRRFQGAKRESMQIGKFVWTYLDANSVIVIAMMNFCDARGLQRGAVGTFVTRGAQSVPKAVSDFLGTLAHNPNRLNRLITS